MNEVILDAETQLLIDALVADGFNVSPYYWLDTKILLGFSFHHEGMEMVFRVEPDTMQIVLVKIQRQSQTAGLNNPFSIMFVLAEAALKVFSPQWRLRGNVDVFRHSRLSSERLGRFYIRWCGAHLDPEPGWYCLVLANYRPLKS